MVSNPRLTGRRILITRTSGRASFLASELESEGASVISIPTIEIVPPESYAALDDALAHLDGFEWIVFTSAHAVEVFGQRRKPEIAPGNMAAIGPATARAIEQQGLQVSLLPPLYVAESLAKALAPRVSGAKVLLIRAAEARDVLPSALLRAGAHLTIAEAYRNRTPSESIPRLVDLFTSPESYPDAITFTSASTARNLAAMLETAGLTLPPKIVLASIGPITSQAMRDLDMEPTVEAAEATIPALALVIAEYFAVSSRIP